MIFRFLAKYSLRVGRKHALVIPREILADMVGTFALIPEVIAFSFVAGVDPEVGLFASFIIGSVISIAGGRPAMISGAAGSVALVAAPLVRAHGVDYFLPSAQCALRRLRARRGAKVCGGRGG